MQTERLDAARARLRGGYALLAGLVLLLAVPLYQGAVLGPAGYAAAVRPAADARDFGPLLLWIAQHLAADRTLRFLDLLAFALPIGLPGPLVRRVWPEGGRAATVALWCGRAGFAVFTLAVLLGLVAAPSAASNYLAAAPAQRPALATGYAATFTAQTLLAYGLGALLLGVALVALGIRLARGATLPPWLGYLSLACAGLLLATTLLTLVTLGSTQAPTAALSIAVLGLWLLCTGLLLLLPGTRAAATQ